MIIFRKNIVVLYVREIITIFHNVIYYGIILEQYFGTRNRLNPNNMNKDKNY